MSKSRNSGDELAMLDEQEVADFLRGHPDFFVRQGALLDELRVPHPTDGRVVSLFERQMALLREANQGLTDKLKQLAQAAKTNEQLLQRMQRLMVQLVACPDLSAASEILKNALVHDFHADDVVLRILSADEFAEETGDDFVTADEPGLALFEDVFARRQAVCGYVAPEQAAFLFGERAAEVASCAVVPLCDDDQKPCIGVLAMASVDPKRFQQEMGTLFLGHLGAVVTSVIRALGRR